MKNMLKTRANERPQGNFTIEAAIILPGILLVLVLLVFSILLLYQKTLMTKTAVSAAQQGAELWKDGTLYSRLLGSSIPYNENLLSLTNAETADPWEGADQDGKMGRLKEFVRKEMKRGILQPKKTVLGMEYRHSILGSRLRVVLRQEFRIPFGQTLTLSAWSEAVITDPAENIRDVDLLMDLAAKAKEKINLDQWINVLKGKLK